MGSIDFGSAFKALTGHDPFPWQGRLFDMLRDGRLPPAVDIPTGLGKTAIMAIWLLARAAGARFPRRLAYVVDRRAVVDQATDFAEKMRERLGRPALEPVRRNLGIAGRALPISTLRGQHLDNREWLEDPAAPAIIVGTVDMVGSRLLFEGYGVSRRMRPYQAGLMGCDTLVLLDEAHLSRPFERLLRTIEDRRAPAENRAEPGTGGFAGPCASASLPPPFRVLPLSATLGVASASASAPFTLDDSEDRKNETVQARLYASKALSIEDLGPKARIEDALAESAWDVAQREAGAGNPVRMLVYCDQRRVAESVATDLRRRAKQARSGAVVILFVGGRRVYERRDAANDLREHGLLGNGGVPPSASVFVVATSAGEVGVDLDADHMVCDLVAWERMVQRLGRVNRRGSGAARVLVIDQGPPETKSETRVDRHRAARALLEALPRTRGGYQAGPAALQSTAKSAGALTDEASTPPRLHPALTRPLIDAWAMTSLAEHSGRPEVDPWLRGWVEEQIPQTTVVWRRWLPIRVDAAGAAGSPSVPLHSKAVEAFFESAAPQAAERLETETPRVVDWLRKRARKLMRTPAAESHDDRDLEVGADSEGAQTDDGGSAAATSAHEPTSPLHPDAPAAFVLDRSGKPVDRNGDSDGVLALRAVNSLTVKALERRLAGQVLVVDARIAGLNEGLLHAAGGKPVLTAEDNWGRPEEWGEIARNGAETTGAPPVRVRLVSHDERERMAARGKDSRAGEASDAWRESWAEPYHVSATDLPLTWLLVEKRRAAATDEDSRAMAPLQRLDEHQEMAAQEAARIAEDLGLGKEYKAMLVAAARHHDDGKRVPRWQRAFNAKGKDGPYAKTPGPLNRHVLDGYRHEFQSMLDAEAGGLDGLDRSDPRFELALHLIAAHHGNARPAIGIDGCDGLPPTAAARKAYAVGLRFARLQRQWGPWGLAWWEALLRAADQRASRALDEAARRSRTEPDAQGSPTTAPEGPLGLFPSSTGAAG